MSEQSTARKVQSLLKRIEVAESRLLSARDDATRAEARKEMALSRLEAVAGTRDPARGERALQKLRKKRDELISQVEELLDEAEGELAKSTS